MYKYPLYGKSIVNFIVIMIPGRLINMEFQPPDAEKERKRASKNTHLHARVILLKKKKNCTHVKHRPLKIIIVLYLLQYCMYLIYESYKNAVYVHCFIQYALLCFSSFSMGKTGEIGQNIQGKSS